MEVTIENMSRDRFMNMVGRCRGQVYLQLNDGGALDVKQSAAVIDTLNLPEGRFKVRFDSGQDYGNVVLSLIGFLR